MEYPTVEHAYQAAKTLDIHQRDQIAAAEGPGVAKSLGRSVTMRTDWNEVKLGIMEFLLRQKFYYEPLRSQLLATGNAELIEGNTWNDTFWGVCRGRGHNHLGRLLMKVRTEYAKENL